MVPSPRDRLLGLERGEEVELLGEEPVVVVEGEPEEAEGLDERAAAELHLGPSRRHRVEGGEALVDPDRVVRAEHGHPRAEPDPSGLPGDRGQHHVGRRDGVVGAVVLAEAEVVDPHPVGQHPLGDHLADHLGAVAGAAVRVERDVTEGVEAEGGAGAGAEGVVRHVSKARPR